MDSPERQITLLIKRLVPIQHVRFEYRSARAPELHIGNRTTLNSSREDGFWLVATLSDSRQEARLALPRGNESAFSVGFLFVKRAVRLNRFS